MTARGGHKKEWKENFPPTSEIALLRRGEKIGESFLLFLFVCMPVATVQKPREYRLDEQKKAWNYESLFMSSTNSVVLVIISHDNVPSVATASNSPLHSAQMSSRTPKTRIHRVQPKRTHNIHRPDASDLSLENP